MGYWAWREKLLRLLPRARRETFAPVLARLAVEWTLVQAVEEGTGVCSRFLAWFGFCVFTFPKDGERKSTNYQGSGIGTPNY